MSWPTAQDYNEAIQNPAQNFEDAELKPANAETTILGLPKAITGGFASVYRMQRSTGDWAVRCFLREFPDQHERYAAIGKHLASAGLRETVGFEYIAKGIRVGAGWFPIVKMEWLQGQLLNQYVEANVSNSEALVALASQWCEMMNAMAGALVAHGDLQHGNVLVVDGQLKLIDYDGMFVPSLSGRQSNEVGHRNYQLPTRGPADFDSYIDNFSAWTVYTSLLILSCDPRILRRLGGGEEYLIFQREDYESPESSAAFALLGAHTDDRIRRIARFFKSIVYLDPRDVPPLDANMLASELPSEPRGNWWRGHVGGGAKAPDPEEPAPAVDVSWVLDHISAPFRGSGTFEISRPLQVTTVVLISLLAATLVLSPAWCQIANYIGWVPLSLSVMGESVLLVWLYRNRPETIEAVKARRRFREKRRELTDLEAEFKALDSVKSAADAQLELDRRSIEARIHDLQILEQSECDARNALLSGKLNDLKLQRMRLEHVEAMDLQRSQDEYRVRLDEVKIRIAALTRSRDEEVDTALRNAQDSYFYRILDKFAIADAEIPGVPVAMKNRLAASRITTAAHLPRHGSIRVTGISPQKISALMAWRNGLFQQYYPGMPRSLSYNDKSYIHLKYDSEINALTSECASIEAQGDDATRAVRSNYTQMKTKLQNAETAAKNEAQNDLDEIADKHGRDQAKARMELERVVHKITDSETKRNERRQQCHKQLLQGRRQIIQLEKQAEAHENVSFVEFLRCAAVR